MARNDKESWDGDNRLYDPEAAAHNARVQGWSDHEAWIFDHVTEGEAWGSGYAMALFSMGFVEHDQTGPDRRIGQAAFFEWVEKEYRIPAKELFNHADWAEMFYKGDRDGT